MSTRALLAEAVRPFGPGGQLLAKHIVPFNTFADALGVPPDDPIVAANDSPPKIGLELDDFREVATRIGCQPAQIYAVWQVESGGGWFRDVRKKILELDGPGGFIDGPHLPKILFEAHKFHKYTNGRFTKSHPNLSSRRWNRKLYIGGQGEWARLHAAMKLDRRAALMSASVGGGQIMGFNYKLAGYNSVEEFWTAQKTSEREHLEAFANFIINSRLGRALRQVSRRHADCKAIAKGYNGSGYWMHKPGYHIRIARAYDKAVPLF